MALIYALALITLLTLVILSLFVWVGSDLRSSASYSESIRVDELARGGVDLVLAEIRNEMIAGSTVADSTDLEVYNGANPGSFASHIRVLNPKLSGTRYPGMIPARILESQAESDHSNLVRTSSSTKNFDPNYYVLPDNDGNLQPLNTIYARGGTTDLPSSNRVVVSPKRWNSAQLLDNSKLSTFPLPEWVLVSRSKFGLLSEADGGPASSKLAERNVNNQDFVVGRFAYAIYDLGGALDINLAGNLLSDEENALRGFPHQVDLSLLPGINNPVALLQWRWPFTNTLGALATPGSQALFDPLRNWLQTLPGDEAVFSRRDLIRYAKENPSVLSLDALRNLTHFSRDLDAPSWVPSNPMLADGTAVTLQNGVNYETEANAIKSLALTGTPTTFPTHNIPFANRNLLKLRTPSSVTTVKDWDGNDLAVSPGDPLLPRRFPLARLDLFRQYDEAKAASQSTVELEKKIRYSFGLVPDPDITESGRWLYIYRRKTGASGSAAPNMRLLSLDEVTSTLQIGPNPSNTQNEFANEPRLPNFFELLQAGILRGESGFGGTVQDALFHSIRFITRLGANIIDQYDEDNHPTIIRQYAYRSAFSQDRSANHNAFGVENLPYLNEVLFMGYRPTTTPDRRMVQLFLEFELWNPHQNAGTWTGSPVEMRLAVLQGALDGSVRFFSPSVSQTMTPDVDFTTYSSETTPFQMRFSYPTSSAFRDPTLLNSQNLSGLNNYSTGGTAGTGAQQINGFLLGEVEAPDSTLTPGPDPIKREYREVGWNPTTSDRPVLFELQYRDTRTSPPVWKTYHVYESRSTSQRFKYDILNSDPFPGSGIARYNDTPGGRPFTEVRERTAGWSLIDPRQLSNYQW
ncbi:MAG: hypothetical protein HC904_06580 [Blastochloris sp.]|nr:hypothetical protein [Blastochloris sp.]